jgi:uncharacterized protein (TIGR04255 family)
MAFPSSQRVIYRRCPLVEVVAQLRFQPILMIDSETPARFQDAIREDYPKYTDVAAMQAANSALPPNLPPQIAAIMQGLGAPRMGGAMHRFTSPDANGKWEVSLTREALGLKTTDYTRWEVFRDRIFRLREVFEQVYRPVGGYIRIGLKYVDLIRRSTMSLNEVSWGELLTPYIAGELAATELGDIESASRQSHCNLGEGAFLTLNTGIALVEGPPAEKCFLIDADFHTHGPTENAHAIEKLNSFNQTAGQFFRWCIQQRLHDAMEPQPVDK